MFVSWADFCKTIGETPESILFLLYRPSILLDLTVRTPLFQRLSRYYRVWTRVFNELYMDIVVRRSIHNESVHFEVDVDGGYILHGDNISDATLILINILYKINRAFNRSHLDHEFPLAAANREAMKHLQMMFSEATVHSVKSACELLEHGENGGVTLHRLGVPQRWNHRGGGGQDQRGVGGQPLCMAHELRV